MALLTRATASSWVLLCRPGLAPRSSFARGRDTAFGEIAQRLATRPPETEFGRGIRHFGLMITRVIMLLVLFVLLVNVVFRPPAAGVVPLRSCPSRGHDTGDDAHDHHGHTGPRRDADD